MISINFIILGIKLKENGGDNMKLPFLQDLGNKQAAALMFKGLNRKELIDDNELSYGENLDSEAIPAIMPRKPISLLRTISSPSTFSMINNKQAYVSGTKFYYDGVERGTVTSGEKAIVDFNGNIVIFPDKKYYDFIDDKWGSFTCPYDIQYATVHYNRIFGIKGSEVFASKVGDFKVWDDYAGTEMDSWAADVYSPGDFTGITSYQDHVVFFKSDQMYELYGYTPSQFKIMEAAKIGCIDHRSIAEVAGMLFFVSEAGVQTYSGGFPRGISEKLNLFDVTKASAIGDGRKYYLSIEGTTYIYDTWQDTWIPYMDVDVLEFGKSNNEIFALARDGKLYELEKGNEEVEWIAITKSFDDGSFNKKSVAAIKLKVLMDPGAELSIYIKLDGREFVLHKIIKQTDRFYSNRRDVITTIPIKRASNYQIKFVGKGNAIIYGEREFLIGSDK